jgi:hypothetical protein
MIVGVLTKRRRGKLKGLLRVMGRSGGGIRWAAATAALQITLAKMVGLAAKPLKTGTAAAAATGGLQKTVRGKTPLTKLGKVVAEVALLGLRKGLGEESRVMLGGMQMV